MNTNNVHTHLLLTGAGFTKNFGGFLGTDVRTRLFNRVSENPELRDILLQERNFESAYSKVLSGEYAAESKNQMIASTLGVFSDLDEGLRGWNWNPGSAYPVNEYALRKLLNRFSGIAHHSSGFIFTLNQDLFLERVYVADAGKTPPELPGVENREHLPLFLPHFRHAQIEGKDFLVTS